MKISAGEWVLIICGVIGCLGLAVGFFVGPLVVLKTAGYTEKARQVKIHSDLMAMVRAAQLYRAVEGRFPRALEETAQGEDPLWIPSPDPWGNSYTYRVL